ncbi:hypothetical protein ACIP5T_03295 [Microbacterium sp. NPDC088619]|uniref:hypothetical protein n=1 Tax=Microbacterium sp. NPDC088619 TaxID=3364196 RepID=UPI0037F928B7
MTSSGKSALLALFFVILAIVSFIRDDALFGYAFFAASIALLSVSYICEAIEKAVKR